MISNLISNLLLDTHTFLWWDSAPEKLSPTILALCRDPAVGLYLSLVSVWEIQIKSSLGKLPLSLPLREIMETQQKNGLLLLPVTLDHVLALSHLPGHHKDPFDRLLIAQAIAEGLTVASADQNFPLYPVSLVW
jgi:PIN domain nuclease of toxin-antitoxin system